MHVQWKDIIRLPLYILYSWKKERINYVHINEHSSKRSRNKYLLNILSKAVHLGT